MNFEQNGSCDKKNVITQILQTLYNFLSSLVNAIQSKPSTAEAARGHHAKRYENGGVPEYRNLRLGNFMEENEPTDDVIPDLLRQYYLDTYLNACDTCESLTHCNPISPIHRGM